jgi:hypothetical protein
MATKNSKGTVWPILPIVPALQNVSCFTRLTGNPWNPGAFAAGLIIRGSRDAGKAKNLLAQIAKSLGVEDEENEDKWACILEKKMTTLEESWLGEQRPESVEIAEDSQQHEIHTRVYPARAFTEDLPRLLQLKRHLTRRQWLSVMDSMLRIASAAELLWVARINCCLARMIEDAAEGKGIPSTDGLLAGLSGDGPLLSNQQLLDRQLSSQIREYAHARIFIGELADLIKVKGGLLKRVQSAGGLGSLKGIRSLLTAAKGKTKECKKARGQVVKLMDASPGFLHLNSSAKWPAQCFFFTKGVLAQRVSADPEKAHFDQGYWGSKPGRARNAPWVFRVGPIGVLTMAHLAALRSAGAATASGLMTQLERYGIQVSLPDVLTGQVGTDLRNLGLVLDSPDAEGGMLIRSPFPN